ncbi:MAG: lysophospholipid acyltransferase family protein [Pseudomonadota bacterium]
MSEGYNQVRDRWSTRALEWVMYAAAWVFWKLSQPFSIWSLSRLFGAIGSRLVLLIPPFRKRVEDNLDLVLPDMTQDARRSLVRETTRNFIHLAIEYAHLDHFIRSMEIKTEGMEHILATRDAGKGAIVVTAHFGNWEAIRVASKREGHEIGIIYRAFNNRYLDAFTMKMIPDAGAPVLQKGSGLRQLLHHVRKGGLMMILVDQRNSGAPFIDFMGQPAETVTAAAEMAAKIGVPLIPARAVRDTANRRFDVQFETPVEGTDPVAMMTEVNSRISAWVTEYPAQWFWFHRRWKSNNRSPSREP